MEERERGKEKSLCTTCFLGTRFYSDTRFTFFSGASTCECEGDTGLLLVTTIKEIVRCCLSVCLFACAYARILGHGDCKNDATFFLFCFFIVASDGDLVSQIFLVTAMWERRFRNGDFVTAIW